MPLMSYDEYRKIEHKAPYLLTLKAGSSFLYYFGERHSFDPDDTQWLEVKKFWNAFLTKTEHQKRIAFVEGGRRPNEIHEKQAILMHGGMGLLTHLANKGGVETYSPEPDEKWERAELEKKFTKEQI